MVSFRKNGNPNGNRTRLTNLSMRHIIPYMGVDLLFYRKNVEPNGDITEMKIWRVPHSKDKPYGLKYSLVYIRDGKRIIGYDNAEGKGDHRHYGSREHLYRFKDMDVLIEDFYNDIERIK